MPDLYGSAIYWLETSHRDPSPSLVGRAEVDVAIIGGGFTGLWTAYHLSEADPGLRLAVVESETIGFGASGRNGGFAMTLLDMSLALLRRNHGDEAARAAHMAVAESVEEIGATITREGIDCEWAHGGLMVVATNPGQLDRIRGDREAAAALGLEGFSWLEGEDARARVHSPTYLGALREEHCAVLHPAKLARGLVSCLEDRGVSVFEQSAVTGVEEARGDRLRVLTTAGVLDASQVVVATNAWATHQPTIAHGISSRVVPLYTYIVLTEPLSEEQWDEIGWADRCGIEDKRNYVHYYRRTLDGRILWGGSDGVIYYGGRIAPHNDRHEHTFERLRRSFRRTFPQLDRVRFTHQWGGPVAITANFVPIFGSGLGGRLHHGVGYNGHGVAPSHTGGKILRDKVLGRTSELTGLCFVDNRSQKFPGEPLRWISAELSRRALLRQDSAFDRGSGGGDMDPLLIRALRRLG